MKINIKLVLGISIVLLASIVIFIVLLSRQPNGDKTQSPQPGTSTVPMTPSPIATLTPARYTREKSFPQTGPTIFQQTEQYQRRQDEINVTLAPTIAVHQRTGALLDIVPYRGTLFTFDYRNRDLSYVVTFDKNQVLEANAEFDMFLKEYGIKDRSWFTRLKIEYK